MTNTNPWIKATAVSKINKIIIKGILIIKNKFLNMEIEERRWIKRCPLIILAVKRTDKVIGRMMFLTVSIITMKKLRAIGEPIGTKWAITILNLLINENKVKVIQNGKAKNIVKTKWEEEVNT